MRDSLPSVRGSELCATVYPPVPRQGEIMMNQRDRVAAEDLFGRAAWHPLAVVAKVPAGARLQRLQYQRAAHRARRGGAISMCSSPRSPPWRSFNINAVLTALSPPWRS